MPDLEGLWHIFEETAEEVMSGPTFQKILGRSSAEERACFPAVITAYIGIRHLKAQQQERSHCIREIATGQRVIPNAEDLDKILRYEAAIDRNLTRALDRLERLQERRKALEGMEPRPTAHNRSNTKSTVFRMPPKSTKSYPTKMPSRGN